MPEPRSIIAITRGIEPKNAPAVARAYVSAGITRIEVPLNSPEPFDSIARMIDAVGDSAQIGAGTVLDGEAVEKLASIGGQFVVSPNANAEVIRATKENGMESWPGVMTPTECFAAIEAGCDGLKLFPAFLIGTAGIKAIRAVLPQDMPLYAVGGVAEDGFSEYIEAGCAGFGLGSSLFKPNWSIETIEERAQATVEAYDQATAKR